MLFLVLVNVVGALGDGRVLDVRKFGAVGDGKSDDSKAFQDAFANACSYTGGRSVILIEQQYCPSRGCYDNSYPCSNVNLRDINLTYQDPEGPGESYCSNVRGSASEEASTPPITHKYIQIPSDLPLVDVGEPHEDKNEDSAIDAVCHASRRNGRVLRPE
ncbi:hypothetical protein SAY86_017735 [Trapa natans]|uniref:Pectate lyase superfamily protein domain-containing protein n=1 Tax=Trapa natans TaxID=22666 RepID=A0AAN7M5M6_TRANT|nr:hypothetical protein SAY86_017735 [Trapa natans]